MRTYRFARSFFYPYWLSAGFRYLVAFYFQIHIENGTLMMKSCNAVVVMYYLLWTIETNAALIQESYPRAGLKEIPESISIDVEELIIVRNNIRDITNESLINYPCLIILDLQANNIRYIHDGAFDNNPNLIILILAWNRLLCTPSDFGPAAISLVKVLFFDGVKSKSELENMNFTKFSQLYELGLGGNGLLKLDIRNLPNTLRNFNLKWGRLSTMPNLHLYTPNISIIIFKFNNISQIPAETIIRMNKLRHLDVYSNNLKTIPGLYHSSLDILEIGKNALCCDASLCWVRLWARKKPVALKVPGKPACSSPDYIEGKLLMEVDPVKMGCYKGTYEMNFIFPVVL